METTCNGRTYVITARADLRYADLQGADLRYANLRYADLQGAGLRYADLRYADLQGADLRYANLRYADLQDANLQGADLRYADLQDAKLQDANLQGADLRYADLQDADLRYAKLQDAKLQDAKLQDANLQGAGLPVLSILPEGDLIGWKKCQGNIMVKLSIPADALRSNATGRKCRASKAIVLEVLDADTAVSKHDTSFKYVTGQTVEVPDFDEDWTVECGRGIHFFITRQEAERY